jgi:hypothetical protein
MTVVSLQLAAMVLQNKTAIAKAQNEAHYVEIAFALQSHTLSVLVFRWTVLALILLKFSRTSLSDGNMVGDHVQQSDWWHGHHLGNLSF